jgi:tRNA1Val (adenine37-N6)-methyltransferase
MSPLISERSGAFRFKHFTVEHDHCAMKVGTDSIALGSWVEPGNSIHILDIGSGCGLLALMMAQKSRADAKIVGVEIDESAFLQSCINTKKSPFPARINMFNHDILDFKPSRKFDLIISNPPYFQKTSLYNKVKGNHQAREIARSQHSLNHSDLLSCVSRLLDQEGKFSAILPYDVMSEFLDKAKLYGLHIAERVDLYNSTKTKPIRTMFTLMPHANNLNVSRLVIYDDKGQYSDEYKTLCKDFYLNF